MHTRIVRALRLSLLASAVVLAGCATGSAPAGRQAARPAAGHVDRKLEAQASAFEAYVRKARAVPADFDGPAAVTRGLAAGAAYEPRQLEAGMIAYAAVAALQEPKFAAALKAERDRKGLARRLAADPQSAMKLPGAQAAAARAGGALHRQGAALEQTGQGVRKAAYGVQRHAWARATVPDARGRLTRVKQVSAAGYRPEGEDAARLRASVAEGGRRSGAASPVVARGVALAALSLMGEPAPKSLSSEPRSAMCLRVAKLNLYQCLASAGPYYEDIYCLGRHALAETGTCVQEAASPARPGKHAGT